jgi:GNAT superfamily N-acetyltransferase
MDDGRSMEGTTQVRIASATERDVPLILKLIRGLAEYEELSGEVTATEETLRESLFGAAPGAEVLIAYAGEDPVGFAVFFGSYSTFLGRRGLHLEDLFVLPQWRGRGFGRRLLARVARIAVERGCGRLEWAVLDWNEPAMEFYRRLGARAMNEWTVCRLTGDALERMADPGPGRERPTSDPAGPADSKGGPS